MVDEPKGSAEEHSELVDPDAPAARETIDAAKAAGGTTIRDDGGAAPAAPAFPAAGGYAVERWVELTDDQAPWWTRPTGIGLRLQLHELEQLAAALQEGKVVAPAVKRLLMEARLVFVTDGRYCAEAFPEITKRLRGALADKEASDLLPGGNALAAVEASLQRLAEVELVDRLVADASEAANRARNLDGLLKVDERITLLDAELAFDGYSREWRARAARAARDALPGAGSLAEALSAGITAAGRRENPTDFDVFVPVRTHAEPDGLALKFTIIERDSAEERVAEWPGGNEQLSALDEAVAALRITDIKAMDVDAAAEMGRDQLARMKSLWELQDGVLELGPDLLLHDVSGSASHKRAISRRLVERPVGLKDYAAARQRDAQDPALRRIADALDQLAQARSGSQGASLADLWTVCETLFGGVAEDRSSDVSDRLAGLTEYLFVRDSLRWFGSRFDPDKLDLEGLKREAGESQAEFGLRCGEELAGTLPGRLVAAGLPLEWTRLKQFLRWDRRCDTPRDKCHLDNDLDAVRDRVAAIGNRAYLVRNLFLHQGNPQRAAAMAVTLPVFAAVLHPTIGYINRLSGGQRSPLVESELAQLRIRHVAAAYFAAPKSGPAPLADQVDLSDD